MARFFAFLWRCFRAAFVHVAVGFQYLFFVKWVTVCTSVGCFFWIACFVAYDNVWPLHWIRKLGPFKDFYLIMIFVTGFSALYTPRLYNHTFGVGRALVEMLEDSKYDEPSWWDFLLMGKALLMSIVSIVVFVVTKAITHLYSVAAIVFVITYVFCKGMNKLGTIMIYMLGAYAFGICALFVIIMLSPNTAAGINSFISADWTAHLLMWGAMFVLWAVTRKKLWVTVGGALLKNPLTAKLSDKYWEFASKTIGAKLKRG